MAMHHGNIVDTSFTVGIEMCMNSRCHGVVVDAMGFVTYHALVVSLKFSFSHAANMTLFTTAIHPHTMIQIQILLVHICIHTNEIRVNG